MPLLIAMSKYSILLFLCQGNKHLFSSNWEPGYMNSTDTVIVCEIMFEEKWK